MSISEKNPKLAKLAGQFLKFYAFSMLVTLLQYLLLTFLPGLFYAHTDWCSIPCQLIHLNLGPVDTYVFNYPVTGDATGGMGYFVAFAITLFLAQCVNFPMQRNITFKSKGNIWYQILWYVIAFVLITIVCSFLMGLYVPLCKQFFSPAVYNVLITVINGGVQMVIYFPSIRSFSRRVKPNEPCRCDRQTVPAGKMRPAFRCHRVRDPCPAQ